MQVLVRVEGGPHVGLGHVQRSLALSAALRARGIRVDYLAPGHPATMSRIEAAAIRVRATHSATPWGGEDLDETSACARAFGCDTVIVDSNAVNADYLGGLREQGFLVCAIDDHAGHPFPCQLVVNGDIDAELLAYDSPAKDTIFLLGTRYILLRPEFAALRRRAAPERPSRRVLITVGGADPDNLMPPLIDASDALPSGWTVGVVVGPYFTHAAAVRAAAERASHPVDVVDGPLSLAPLIADAELAICAGGQTLYELACLGCPAVAVAVDREQQRQLDALARRGAVRSAGVMASAADGGRVRAVLEEIVSDLAGRRSMAGIGMALVDGAGADRVAEVLERQGR